MQNPALNPAILLAPAENGYVAYDPAADRLHELNPLAALIAELCDGSRTVDEIAEIVGPLLPEGQAGAIERWIADAVAGGLLCWGGDSGGAHRELSARELKDLAQRLRSHGKVQTAFICQKHATELAADDAEAWCDLGELAHIVGRREQARAAYEKYLEFEPGDAEVKHILVALRDETPPTRVPDECIQQLYKRFSNFYESNMCDSLGYDGPKRVHDLIQPLLADRDGMAVLDLGCGSGLAGVQFKPRAARLVGVDLSPEMIELARERALYDRVEVAEIGAWLEKNEERFDLAVSCDTFIYFGDLRELTASIAKALDPNGIFAFTVERGDHYPYHLADSGRYTHHPNYLREVATASGMEVACLEEGFLRMEYGAEVTGLFAAFRMQRPDKR